MKEYGRWLTNNLLSYMVSSGSLPSARGFPSPKIALRLAVSAKAFTGSVTVRGFKFSLGRLAKSPTKMSNNHMTK